MAITSGSSQKTSTHELEKDSSNLSKRTNLNNLIEENKKLESELHLTLEEIAHLQNALANANMQLAVYQNFSKEKDPTEKKEFNIVSEEFKEIYVPINTISNYCDLLLSQSVGILGTLQRKFVERIDSSADQMRDLIEEFQEHLLTNELHNIESRNSIDLHLLLEQIVANNTLTLREKQIVLQMEVPEDLPKLYGNESEISKVIELIIVNAFSITPKDGSVRIMVTVKNILSSKKVTLNVHDGGPGIPANELKKLFSLPNLHRPGEIPGLAIDRTNISLLSELIKKQGGEFTIRNAPGFGSIFEVTFYAKN